MVDIDRKQQLEGWQRSLFGLLGQMYGIVGLPTMDVRVTNTATVIANDTSVRPSASAVDAVVATTAAGASNIEVLANDAINRIHSTARHAHGNNVAAAAAVAAAVGESYGTQPRGETLPVSMDCVYGDSDSDDHASFHTQGLDHKQQTHDTTATATTSLPTVQTVTVTGMSWKDVHSPSLAHPHPVDINTTHTLSS